MARLCQAEANRFAYKLKTALENTNAFGVRSCRTKPRRATSTSLAGLWNYGEDVEIEVKSSTSAVSAGSPEFPHHEVDEGFHKNVRNEARILIRCLKTSPTRLRFRSRSRTATSASPTFGLPPISPRTFRHMKIENGQVDPSPQRPDAAANQSHRVRDQLFVDGLQQNSSLQPAHGKQLPDLAGAKSARDRTGRQSEKAGQAAMGVLSSRSGCWPWPPGRDRTMSISSRLGRRPVSGAAGGRALANSFQTKEAEVHRDGLNWASPSTSIWPPRSRSREKTVSLTGDAQEQFGQWRDFLQEIYEEERTPKKKL